MISLICGTSKRIQMSSFTNRNILTDIESKPMVTKGKRGWGRDKLGVGD